MCLSTAECDMWTGKPTPACDNDRSLPPWKSPGCTLPGMLESRGLTEQTDWRAKQPSKVPCAWEDLGCVEACDASCEHKTKHTIAIDRWRRQAQKEEKLDDIPRKDVKGPPPTGVILQTVSKSKIGETSGRWNGVHGYGHLRASKYHLELN